MKHCQFFNYTQSGVLGSNPVTGGEKIPIAAKVQTIFFGLTMIENTCSVCKILIAKPFM